MPTTPDPARVARAQADAAAYVADNFADAPAAWLADQIAATARYLADPDDKGSAHWRRALIVAYTDVLLARALPTPTEGA